MTPIRKASCVLVERYKTILNQNSTNTDLIKMCDVILDNTIDMYDDKVSRWLGYIQGVMISQNLLSVEDERNISRPLFHQAYEEMGLEKPKTISV